MNDLRIEKTRIFRSVITTTWAAAFLSGQAVFGLGFKNPDQGAAASAQGEAFVAQADDASAIYYNPAGLTQLTGLALNSGTYLLLPTIRYSGAAGSETMDTVSFLPQLYVATDLGTQRWRAGLGLYVPYGSKVEWDANGPFRYDVTRSELSVFTLAPVIAYQLTDNLSVGATLNIHYGRTQLDRMVPFSLLFGTDDGHFRFKGYGWAVSTTLGLQWRINHQHRVGIVYHSPFAVTFDGSVRISNDPTGGNFAPSAAEAQIQFPQSVAFGYAYWPTPKLKLEADAEWVNWETLNSSRLRSPNPYFDASGNPSSVLRFNWQDSWAVGFGTQYSLSEKVTLRAGYVFAGNSIPDATYSPTIPDANRHTFSVGLGSMMWRIKTNLSYQYILGEPRTVTGSATTTANGRWELGIHALMVSSELRF